MTLQTYFKALIIIGIISGLSACGNQLEKNTGVKDPIEVSVAKPQLQEGAVYISASGRVESKETALLSTRMMGRIQRIYVDIGDVVQKGQLLYVIDAADISAKSAQVNAQIAQAEAAFQNAQKDYERYQALFKENSATQKELENMQLQYTVAKNQLEAAKEAQNEVAANMNYAKVKAPFSGVITQKMMNDGNLARPGMPILAMEGEQGLRIKASVSEQEIGKLQVGDTAQISIDAIRQSLNGQVTRVSSSSANSGGQYTIEVSLPKTVQKEVKSGMYAHISIMTKSALLEEDKRVLIPSRALIYKDDLQGIYTVSSKGTALLRWLRIGKTYGESVEVLSGLTSGETYILETKGRIYNGAPVKIVE